VHRNARRLRLWTDVTNATRLRDRFENLLKRATFAERPMHDREDHIGLLGEQFLGRWAQDRQRHDIKRACRCQRAHDFRA
jgi:hypothetical protein